MDFLLFFFLFSHSSHAVEAYSYPKQQKVSINSEVLAGCFLKEINKYPNQTRTTEPLFIYRDNKTEHFTHKPARCKFDHDAFFDYMIAGEVRCDYSTGQEQKLRDWIMSKADNSVDPVNIFREALKLNGGSTFNAALTIHQLLRNEARYKGKAFYYNSTPDLEKSFWNKFVDIRGDLEERGKEKGFEADHQGSWYRIWGIMGYRFSLNRGSFNDDESMTCGYSEKGLISSQLKAFKANSTAIAAEAIKYPMDFIGDYQPGADRPGKMAVNLAGSHIATIIEDSTHKRALSLQTFPDDKVCENQGYLEKD
ncbi:hypothetical protein ACLVWU_17320 [Bdellovibrio sp. HCB290]|uniref:hypothetical protein n=1 Tax=Bdellovibrio sp. HCB290 TaxID=3394356 RepID=UPI0039B69370